MNLDALAIPFFIGLICFPLMFLWYLPEFTIGAIVVIVVARWLNKAASKF